MLKPVFAAKLLAERVTSSLPVCDGAQLLYAKTAPGRLPWRRHGQTGLQCGACHWLPRTLMVRVESIAERVTRAGVCFLACWKQVNLVISMPMF